MTRFITRLLATSTSIGAQALMLGILRLGNRTTSAL